MIDVRRSERIQARRSDDGSPSPTWAVLGARIRAAAQGATTLHRAEHASAHPLAGPGNRAPIAETPGPTA